jgi:hypothetical protein
MIKSVCTLLLLATFSNLTAQKTWDGGAGTNNWADGNNWNPNGVPNATQTVTIGNGFTVVLNVNATIASLTIGGGASGQLTLGNNNTNRTLTVTGNVAIQNGAVLQTAGNGGNVLNIGGALQNNGTFDMRLGGATANVTFNGTSSQSVTGTGGTTDFNTIVINNTGAANNNIVDFASDNFSAAAGFLTLTDGIARMSGTYTFTNTFFNTGNPTINANSGIWLNNPNVTVTGQNGDTQLSGLFRITNGTYNIGITADWWLAYNNGAQIIIEGGAVNITGALKPNTAGQTATYNQSAGTVSLCTVGNTFAFGSFDLSATGCSFTMSGGTMFFPVPSSAVSDYINNAATSTVTGGLIQFGTATTGAGSVFQVTTSVPFYNLTIHATNNPTFRFTTAITISGDLTNGGTIDVPAFNQNISLTGNWTNNNTFNAGTGTVTFNGASAQTLGGSSTTTFNNVTFNNSGSGVTLASPADVSGTATFTSGIVGTTVTNLLTMNAGSAVAGGSATSHINGPMAKTGTTAFTFPVGNGTIYRTIGIGVPSASSTFRAQFLRTNPVIAVSPYSLGPGLTRTSACEYWTLDRTAGTGNATVTLSWAANSPCPSGTYVNDIATLRVARHTGAGGFWQDQGQTANTGNISAGTITSNTVSIFSPFTLASAGTLNPLPVTITQLNASKRGTGVVLSFANLTEKDVAYYELQRSFTASGFNTLQQIVPRHNNGTATSYEIIDAVNNEPVSFYRVKVKLITGEEVFTAVVKVSSADNYIIKVLSNPTTNKTINIQFSGNRPGTYELELFNSYGQKQLKQTVTAGGNFTTLSINLPSTIQTGTYFLHIRGREQKFVEKIIIQ